MTGPVWDGRGEDPWMPERLAAELDAAAAERSIREAVWAALSDWLVRLSRRVLRGQERPDPDAVWALAPAWREAVDLIIGKAIEPAMRRAYTALLGDDYPWDQRVFVTRYLAEVRNRLVRIPEEVYDLIAGQMAAGVNLGESIPQLANRVDEVLAVTTSERWQNRAVTVARTECLPGEAPVDGAYATAVYRRHYSGPMVTVKTVGGRKFTGTPNHPVLTTDGWVGLGSLLKGDRVLCDRGRVESASSPGDQNVEAGPTSISEVFDALQTVGVTRRERTAQPDFHGDRPEGYVDVLSAFGVLPIGSFAKIEERSVDLILSPSDLAQVLLACERAPFPRGDSIDQASGLLSVAPVVTTSLDDSTDRLEVSGISDSESLAGLSCDVPGHDLLLREVSALHGVLTSLRVEVLARIGQGASQAGILDDISNSVSTESGLSRDLPVAEPGSVEIDEIASISIAEWSGHVFNLTTVNGYFVSGGLYTGNTIGALNAGRTDAFRAFAEETGEELERVWLATEDSRTRETHRLADGQRVGMDQPFVVGGFPLMFPGDPAGPPQEVINCVIGSTEVRWTGQYIAGSMSRVHEGPFVQIVTAEGHDLTVTPNHPVLTPEGYVPAGLLRPKQSVMATHGAPPPQVEDVPSRIEEVHRAFGEMGAPQWVTGTRMDFHGDGADSEVEIVGSYGYLPLNPNPQRRSKIQDPKLFGLSNRERPLSGLGGAVVLRPPRYDSTGGVLPDTLVSRGSQGTPLGGGHAGEAEPVGLTAVPDYKTQLREAPDDGRTAEADFPAHLQYALALGMAPVEIVEVNRFTGRHQVYNLSTSDHWYTGNGIALHNCRCTVLLVEPGESVDLSNRQMRRS